MNLLIVFTLIGVWELCKLGTLAEIVRGASPRPIQDSKWFDNTSDVGWLRISDVTEQNGRIYKLEQKLSKAGQEKTRVLRKPHLLLSIAATVGKPVVNYVNTGVHDGFLIFLNPLFDREFMFQWLEMFTPKWQKYGQPGSQLNLNSELVRNQELRMPSTNEQEKIGMLFKYLDDTITLHQRKLDQLKKLKKAYLHAMFVSMNTKKNKVPKLRFTDFEGDWELCKLGRVVERVTRKNKELKSTLPLTISAQEGLIDQNVFFNKSVASRDVSGYYLIYNGEFAYNKSYSNGYPWGAIKRLNRYDMGVLSTLYIIFKPKNIDSNFLEKYYDTSCWYHEVSKHAAEGARNHGLLNIAASDFLRTELTVPKSVEEQRKVGNFLKQLDDTITLHQRKLEQLKELKKAYLQVMFPAKDERVPKVRFAAFEGEWAHRKLGEITESFSGGTPTAGKSEYYGGDIPFIRSGEISSDSTELFITENGLNSSSAKMVKVGDILYALYGATSGEVGISKITGAINQAILAIRPSKNDNSYLIIQWLRKQKNTIISTYLQGGQGNLSSSIVKNLIIMLPQNKEEQEKVGIFFKRLDDIITLHQNKLEQLKDLKTSYLQNMFI